MARKRATPEPALSPEDDLADRLSRTLIGVRTDLAISALARVVLCASVYMRQQDPYDDDLQVYIARVAKLLNMIATCPVEEIDQINDHLGRALHTESTPQ